MSEKLVRDKMPELCEKTPGWTPMTHRVAEFEEMSGFLSDKLKEESQEVVDALKTSDRNKLIEEIADLQEVILGLEYLLAIDPDEVETVRSKKADHRGGFYRRVIWDGKK